VKALASLGAVTFLALVADRLTDVRHGLNAAYFAGPHWGDAAAVAGIDAIPSTDVLKQRRPDFAEHAFSVEWRGYIAILRSGTYTFGTTSDDGSWLYVDGKPVVESPGRHSQVDRRGSIELSAGVYPILIRYFQDGGDCAFEAIWARDGDAIQPIPESAWLTEPASYWQVVGRRLTEPALIIVLLAWWLVIGAFAKWAYREMRKQRWLGPGGFDIGLSSVLVLSTLVNIWAVWWGLPNTRGWAPDEIVPADVLDAWGMRFSGGWYGKYPPFHYGVLSVAYAPLLALSWLGVLDLEARGPYLGLFLIGRLVSVVLGEATVLILYVCGRELYGSRGAVYAALTAALMVPFAYYGKTTNLEVPYLFWFAVSLLAYIRILQRHARSDYFLFAASAALAVSTKDQAYGLVVLSPLAIIAARWIRSKQGGGSSAGIVFDRTTMQAAMIAVGTFLLADNLLLNFSGFVEHVRMIVGPASSDYQMFPATMAGQLRMAWFAIRELRYMFGWPLSLIVAIAVGRAIWQTTTKPSLGWLLIPVLSYYAAFIGVVLYFYDRFLLPIGLVLSLCAGWWLQRFVAPGVRARHVRLGLISAAFAYSVIYVATVDYALTTDSRYELTRWMKAHVNPNQVVAARGPLEYCMLAEGFTAASVESVEDVAEIRPAFIVLNPVQIATLLPGHPVRVMRDALVDGRVPYRLVARFQTAPLPWPGRHPDLGTIQRQPEFSSLAVINPPLEVFERLGSQ
jgi:hypothetical protein